MAGIQSLSLSGKQRQTPAACEATGVSLSPECVEEDASSYPASGGKGRKQHTSFLFWCFQEHRGLRESVLILGQWAGWIAQSDITAHTQATLKTSKDDLKDEAKVKFAVVAHTGRFHDVGPTREDG